MLFCINRSTPNLLRIYNPQQCPITHSIRQVNTYSEIIMFDHLEIYFCTINKFCAVQMFVIFVTNTNLEQAQAACTKVICSTRKKPFLSIYSAIDLLPSIRESTLNKFTIFKIITINSKILVNLNNLKQITIRKIVIDKQHEAIL